MIFQNRFLSSKYGTSNQNKKFEPDLIRFEPGWTRISAKFETLDQLEQKFEIGTNRLDRSTDLRVQVNLKIIHHKLFLASVDALVSTQVSLSLGNPFYLTSKKEKTDSLDLETDSRAHSEVRLIESFNLNPKISKIFQVEYAFKKHF